MARPGQARATAARQDVAAIMQALKLGLELVFDIRQALRARRAEAVQQRQRAALLELLVQTMAELRISMAELNAARRSQPGRIAGQRDGHRDCLSACVDPDHSSQSRPRPDDY